MTTLFLILKGEWFDKILSGEKVEEYRKISPRYVKMFERHYDAILFQHGYSLKNRRMMIELKNIKVENSQFVLSLGKIISVTNLSNL